MYYLLFIVSIVSIVLFIFLFSGVEFIVLILLRYINFLKNKYLWHIKHILLQIKSNL
jgi:hypothetical protein